MVKKIPTSLLSRAPKLLKVAGQVVGMELKEKFLSGQTARDLQNKLTLAKTMTEQLSQLRGAAMKLGQLLSIDAADYLPPEALEILSKLQKDAQPLDYSFIDPILQDQLGEHYSQITVSPKALAVASIGQVHRATFGPQEIVLKIKYPDIEKTIDSDILLLKLIAKNANWMMNKNIDLNPLLAEIRSLLLQETDYKQEAESLTRAGELFAGDDRYLVPKVIAPLCRSSILAMEYMEGTSLQAWLATSPSSEAKSLLGRRLYELFIKEFFELGFVQTDPNPGNFLVNSRHQIVLLDYGATKFYPKEFISNYTELLKHAYHCDKKLLMETTFRFGLLDPRESLAVQDLYYDMMVCMTAPFRKNQNFSFDDKDYYAESKRYSIELTSQCKFSPPPHQIIFLHRKLGGVFSLLKKMQVEINLHQYWLVIQERTS